MNYDSTNHALNPDPLFNYKEPEPYMEVIRGEVIDLEDPITREVKDYGYSCEYMITKHEIKMWNVSVPGLDVHNLKFTEALMYRILDDIRFDTPGYMLDDINSQLSWENNGYWYLHDGKTFTYGLMGNRAAELFVEMVD